MRSLLLAALALLLQPPQQAAAQLFVASETAGILRVSEDGEVLEVLSTTPAVLGRMAGPQQILFLTPASNDVHLLDLTTHAERIVTTLPGDSGLGCGGLFRGPTERADVAPYLVSNHVHFDASVVADASHACFEVMDRNLNMMSVQLMLDVPLDGSAITTTMLHSEHCGGLSFEAQGALSCAQLIRRRVRQDEGRRSSHRAPWTLRSHGDVGSLRGPNHARRRLALTGPILEQTSPDGRWAVLSANRDEGDYIYRAIYLVDLERGRLHPIRQRPWPRPIPTSTLRDAAALAALGMTITGETSLVWMGHGHTLLIGGRLLLRPGRNTTLLPGNRIL